MARVYGQWSGNERGTAEDTSRCIVAVYSGRSFIASQCRHKRGHGVGGLFCKQHAKRYPNGTGLMVPEDNGRPAK